MGVVFEASHARLAGRYAIKVLLQKLSDNPEALERFDREARITSSLQHPNIVQVIDFNTHTDGTEYLVMEFLQGETLAERLARRGALPMELVVTVVEHVAAGLYAAHSHGVVHRDLKPDNVFLVPIAGHQHELAKVLDFGISKAKDLNHGVHGPQSALMGTPQYMSPEQCQGRSKAVDARTDQFALAVITYEMLTGQPPFAGDSVGTVLSQVLYANPPPMHLNPEVEQVVRRGLAKAPEDRFPSVTAFATALRVSVAADLALRARLHTQDPMQDPMDDPLGNPLDLVAIAGGDKELSQALAKTVRDESARARRRRSRREWGAAALTGSAVAVTLFFVVGAKSLNGDRHATGNLPAPAAHKEQIADFALQPPKLPALTATTGSARTTSATNSATTTTLAASGNIPDSNPGEQPAGPAGAGQEPATTGGPTTPGATVATPERAPVFDVAGGSANSMERPPVKNSSRPRREIDRSEFDKREAEPPHVLPPPFSTIERRTAAPVQPVPTNTPSVSRPASVRSERSSTRLDDDAILPLDDSFGEGH